MGRYLSLPRRLRWGLWGEVFAFAGDNKFLCSQRVALLCAMLGPYLIPVLLFFQSSRSIFVLFVAA